MSTFDLTTVAGINISPALWRRPDGGELSDPPVLVRCPDGVVRIALLGPCENHTMNRDDPPEDIQQVFHVEELGIVAISTYSPRWHETSLYLMSAGEYAAAAASPIPVYVKRWNQNHRLHRARRRPFIGRQARRYRRLCLRWIGRYPRHAADQVFVQLCQLQASEHPHETRQRTRERAWEIVRSKSYGFGYATGMAAAIHSGQAQRVLRARARRQPRSQQGGPR